MSDYSRFIRWSSGCRNHRSTGGQTAGDTMYLGLTDYDQPFPCPNGLGVDTRTPDQVPAWRARIEKAKRDIERHREQVAWKELGSDCGDVFSPQDVSGLVSMTARILDEQ